MVTSRCICGSYTSEMHCKMSGIKYYMALYLLLTAIACTNRQTVAGKLLSDPANGLLQVKTTNQHTIVMEVLPNKISTHNGNNKPPGFLCIKLVLKSNEKMKGSAAMQYINFGIGNSLYAIQGTDSLPCIACERIPGISEKEFLYLVFFDNTHIWNSPETSLRLLVADTIAGFGTTLFDIKKEAIEKLEVLK